MYIFVGILLESIFQRLSCDKYHDTDCTDSLVFVSFVLSHSSCNAESRCSDFFRNLGNPAERQTVGAPWAHSGATCHAVTLQSLYLKHRHQFQESCCSGWSPGRYRLASQAIVSEAICSTLALRNINSSLPVSTVAELSAKDPDSPCKPGADAFTEMGQCPQKRQQKLQPPS